MNTLKVQTNLGGVGVGGCGGHPEVLRAAGHVARVGAQGEHGGQQQGQQQPVQLGDEDCLIESVLWLQLSCSPRRLL